MLSSLRDIRLTHVFSKYRRQDGNPANGNIGRHNVFVSTDGTNFGSPLAFGTWLDDPTLKTAAFETVPARYIRIQAITEAGNRGPWTSAADINVYAAILGTPSAGQVGPQLVTASNQDFRVRTPSPSQVQSGIRSMTRQTHHCLIPLRLT